jgi:hypothetical protein
MAVPHGRDAYQSVRQHLAVARAVDTQAWPEIYGNNLLLEKGVERTCVQLVMGC